MVCRVSDNKGLFFSHLLHIIIVNSKNNIQETNISLKSNKEMQTKQIVSKSNDWSIKSTRNLKTLKIEKNNLKISMWL